MSLAEHLQSQGMLSADDVMRAVAHAGRSDGRLIDAVTQLSLLDGHQLAHAVSQYYRLPEVSDGDWPTALDFAATLSQAFLRQHKLLPLALHEGRMVVATADPADSVALRALRLAAGCDLELRIAPASEIVAALDRLTTTAMMSREVPATGPAGDTADDVEHLKDLALGAPVVRIVNDLLLEARRTRATDVHIEPARSRLIVRLRIDGLLREVRSPPAELGRAIVSRIKILSGLDIAERRLPQDGRARLRLDGQDFDLRIATVPTINGESCAIRLLDNGQQRLDLAQLGFSPDQESRLRRHLAAPYGLILVTGPTGSGKTTTLATALSILNEPTRKILTIEDPIEYQLEGVNQIQVKPEIGVSFAHALRSFLRHDPDVIMVGELRDSETARIAVQAAMTGHLVLSTLHTNSAAGAVTRLLDMGVDGYLLASCLRAVIGQRLVRTLCSRCREPVTDVLDLPNEVLSQVRLNRFEPIAHFRPTGCSRCYGSGYSGRSSIVEFLEVDESVRSLIKPGVSLTEVSAVAMRNGMRPMAVDGVEKCLSGVTTADEVRRVAMDL